MKKNLGVVEVQGLQKFRSCRSSGEGGLTPNFSGKNSWIHLWGILNS
jgi:hypothetical protein